MNRWRLQKSWRSLAKALDRAHTRRLRFCGQFVGIDIGRKTIIRRGAELSTQAGGSITIGAGCEIMAGARVLSYGGDIVIGDACSVNYNSILYGHGGLTIGNGVRIAAGCTVIPANHSFDDLSTPIYKQPEIRLGIVVEDDVWIAAHCVILDGVTIARGCVIGAGSVVTKSTEPNGVYAGIPARKLKERGVGA